MGEVSDVGQNSENYALQKIGMAVRISGKPLLKKKRKTKKSMEAVRRERKQRHLAMIERMTEEELKQYRANKAKIRRDKRMLESEDGTVQRSVQRREARTNANNKLKSNVVRGKREETEIQKASRRKRNAEYMRRRRANMTEEELLMQRKKQAQRMRDVRAGRKPPAQIKA